MKPSAQTPIPGQTGLLYLIRSGSLLAILPAVLSLGFAVAVFLAAVFGVLRPTAGEFQQRAALAIEAGRLREAVILLRRQLMVDPAAIEPRFEMLKVFIALPQPKSAAELFNQLAPGDRVVFGPAHLLRAERFAAEGLEKPGVQENVRKCLELALRADPEKGQGLVEQDQAQSLLAALGFARKDWLGAIAAVDRIAVPKAPQLVIKAGALKKLKRVREATDLAVLAESMLIDAEKAVPTESQEQRRIRASALAQIFLIREDYVRAVDVVLGESGDPAFQAIQAGTIRQASEGLRASNSGDSVSWLATVTRGLVMFPEDLGLTMELMEGVAGWGGIPGFTERVSGRLQEAGLEAHPHLLSGIAALDSGTPSNASDHFKAAWELLPENPVMANHHAALLVVRPSDADRALALKIIDGVLEKHPQVASFLDTKGQVLLSLRRVEDAVIVLEAALNLAPLPSTHLALSQAYTQLGEHELADHHRKLAGER